MLNQQELVAYLGTYVLIREGTGNYVQYVRSMMFLYSITEETRPKAT